MLETNAWVSYLKPPIRFCLYRLSIYVVAGKIVDNISIIDTICKAHIFHGYPANITTPAPLAPPDLPKPDLQD
jgi:hypothetical protein